MSIRNTARSWGSLSKAFHWIIVLLILNQWIIAERAKDLPKGPALIQALWWHKSFGITILMLAVLRLAWRRTASMRMVMPKDLCHHRAWISAGPLGRSLARSAMIHWLRIRSTMIQ